MLGNRVGLDAECDGAVDLPAGATPGGVLEQLDIPLVGHRAGADCHVVRLGENPPVEIRRHVPAHVHLRQLLVVLHLRLRDPHPLLESDGELVVAGADGLGHARVGSIGADHGVDLDGRRNARGLAVVARVVQPVRLSRSGRLVHTEEKPVDHSRTALAGALTEIIVEDFAPEHADVLVGLQGLADVNGHVGRGDHLHLADAAVDDIGREFELAHHAQGDGAAAGLAVVHLALEEDCFYAALGESLGRAAARRPTAHDGDSEATPRGKLWVV